MNCFDRCGVGALLLLGVLATTACDDTTTQRVVPVRHEGDRLDGTPPEEVLSLEQCANPDPGSSPLRRLTNREYENSLLALGLEPEKVSDLVGLLPNEPESLGFRNGAQALTVNSLLVQKYRQIAEELAILVAQSCDGAQPDCARSYILDMGLRLHRRPLTDTEVDDYLGLFDKARTTETPERALSWVITAMLQSPYFLYRVEIPGERIEPVRGYEMASRLSYTFWQAPPDDELLNAAAAGLLETEEQVLEQTVRLLSDPKAQRVYDFFEQWLDLDELSEIDRDPELYPDINPQLPELLRAESRAFIGHLLSDSSSTFSDLLGANYTFANEALAEHYGLPKVEGDSFVRVETPGRSGVLTQGMLAVKDTATHTSIVRRGLKVRTDFLCQLVPAPPDTVDLSLEGIGQDLTQAQRLEIHREIPSCRPCHQLMDPIGLAFDGFDAVGRARTADEYGNPLDTAGELTGTRDVDRPVNDVHEVARALSESSEAEQCYVIQNFRYFFGRDAEEEDLCSQAQLTRAFRQNGQTLSSLLLALAQSDAFLYKAGLSGEELQ